MDGELRFLTALKESRPAWDEPADWRAALALYEGLSPSDAAALDRTVLAMIDVQYRNPHASHEQLPFDDVMVNLPLGMSPDDLLCIEAAVLVASERRLGEAFYAFNRLMRLPAWHPIQGRLEWLPREGVEAGRKLALTRAGRAYGALLGLAAGDGLDRNRGAIDLPAGSWTEHTAMALAAARAIMEAPADPVDAGGGGALIRTLPAAIAYGPSGAHALRVGQVTGAPSEPVAAVAVYDRMVDALLSGAARQEALEAALPVAGPLAERLTAIGHRPEAGVPSNGHLVDTLEAAIWSFLRTNSLEECVVTAVNLGDDASAVGGVAGGLAGAAYGPHAIPRRWSVAITGRGELEQVAEGLHRLFLNR